MTCSGISLIPIIICRGFPEEILDLIAHQRNSYYIAIIHKIQLLISILVILYKLGWRFLGKKSNGV